MKALEDAMMFYESQLPGEIIEECRTETNNETDYMERLIEKYNETSNDIHKKLNIRIENRDKPK